ncbi:hypothetical protein [Geodermatophilus chilensis]|uniref:hypothetical protein n=1 Tax=Geodermatophilus chilensis TaxID=2035835 RepID=UPI000C256429|nr:hypothetical protein [Geodermatophilus chilensis]
MPAAGDTAHEQLVDQLLPIAAELVGTVRDYGPDDVAAVLARVPAGRHDALAVVLAAMVDPDRSPAELLAWLDGPTRSRPFTPDRYNVKKLSAEALGRRGERRAEIARLSALRVPAHEIARRLGITTRSVVRHRTAIRASNEVA